MCVCVNDVWAWHVWTTWQRQSSPTFMWALLSSRDVRVRCGLEEVWFRRRYFHTNEGTLVECSQDY